MKSEAAIRVGLELALDHWLSDAAQAAKLRKAGPFDPEISEDKEAEDRAICFDRRSSEAYQRAAAYAGVLEFGLGEWAAATAAAQARREMRLA